MKPWYVLILFFGFTSLSIAEDEPTSTEEPAVNEASPAETTSNEGDSASDSPPKQYVVPNKAKERNSDVIRYLKNFQRDDELIEILGKNGNISGLYLPENTGKPQGGVLILHDIDQHAHWPNTVTPIREYLPDYGWNTLSIFFDDYLQKPLPKVTPFEFSNSSTESGDATTEEDATDAPENETNTEANELAELKANSDTDPLEDVTPEQDPSLGNADEQSDPLDEVANSIEDIPDFVPPINQDILQQPAIPLEEIFMEDMIQRTEDGLNSLNTMGQFNTAIIANGLSANWAAKMLQARLQSNNIGYALILIDPKASEFPEVKLNDVLAELNIPMLDIITQDSPENIRASKARKGTIMRKQNTQYTQIYLPAVKVSLYDSDNMISRRIRGWLKTNAAGEEVPVKVNSGL